MEKGKIVEEVEKIVRNYLPEDYKILIFGSWAQDKALKGSDIDIGILGKEKAPWSSMTKISQAVEKIPTLRSIDIVDLNAVEENFKNKVLEYAKVL